MRKRIFNVLLVILIFSSCEHKSPADKEILDFQDPVELKGKQIAQNYFELATIQHIDSLVVATTNMNRFFQVFNKDGDHITSLGRAGRGPGEFLRTPFLTNIYRQDSTTYGVVYDEVLKEAATINFTASILDNKLIVHDRPPLPPKFKKSPLYEYFYIKENKYAGMFDDRFLNQLNNQRSGFYYEIEQDSLTILPLKNLEIQPYELYPEANLNNRTMRVSPDRSKLAFAMMYYPMVEIFETGGAEEPVQYLIDSNNPSEGPFKLRDYKENNLTEYFIGLYTSDKYLYVLGAKNNESEDKGQYIFVMNWEGNAERKYLIPDEYDLNFITVDEKNKFIYGISYDHVGVYRFDYSHIE